MSTVTKAVTRSSSETPYQLDSAQTLKASGALLKHIVKDRKERETKSDRKNLLTAGHEASDQEGEGAEAEPIQLIITTKKQIVQEKSLKPRKIPVPHTLNVDSAVSSICLITPDPQRSFKDAVADPAFPPELGSKIRVLGVEKLKARYKSFEQKRQLRDEHDIFLADDRIIPMLPSTMGKVFFESGAKRPLPVSLSTRERNGEGRTFKGEKKINSNKRIKREGSKDVSVATPAAFAHEIGKTLGCAQIHLTPSVTTSIRVGWSTFTPEQLAENVEAVVKGMVERFTPKGWRSIRSILIKGPKTVSLPIWQTPELWEEEQDVIEDGDKERLEELEGVNRKRRAVEDGERVGGERGERGGSRGKKQKLLSQSADSPGEMEARQLREKLRKQKQQAKRAIAAGA